MIRRGGKWKREETVGDESRGKKAGSEGVSAAKSGPWGRDRRSQEDRDMVEENRASGSNNR